jgi:hypothetical protein
MVTLVVGATRQTQRLSGLGLKQRYEIRERASVARRVDYPRFALPDVGASPERELTGN